MRDVLTSVIGTEAHVSVAADDARIQEVARAARLYDELWRFDAIADDEKPIQLAVEVDGCTHIANASALTLFGTDYLVLTVIAFDALQRDESVLIFIMKRSIIDKIPAWVIPKGAQLIKIGPSDDPHRTLATLREDRPLEFLQLLLG